MKFELREMDFGMIIDRGLKLFKDNFVPLIIIIALFYGPFIFMMNYSQLTLFQSFSGSNFITNILDQLMKGKQPTPEDFNFDELMNQVGSSKLIGVYMAVAFLLLFLAPLAYLSVYRVLSEYLVGKTITIGEAIGFAGSKYKILLLAIILAVLIFMAFMCVSSIAVCGVSLLIPCLGAFIASIFIVLVSFFASLYTAFLPCVVANENVSSYESLGRSWRLLKGFWWRSLGIYLLTSVIFGVIVWIFSAIGQAVGTFLPDNLEIPYNSAISTLFTVIFQPIMWTVIFLLYIDIRIRKEGFDLNILAQYISRPEQPSIGEEKPSEEINKDDTWA